MSSNEEQLTMTEAVNNKTAKRSVVDRIKNSFKRHTLWWIIGIVLVAVVIGLVIWGIVALVKRGKTETFVPFDIQTNPGHAALNIQPETSYLKSYIESALAINNPLT